MSLLNAEFYRFLVTDLLIFPQRTVNILSVGGGAANTQCFTSHPGLPQGRSQVFCQVVRSERSIFRSYGHRMVKSEEHFIKKGGFGVIPYKQQHHGICVPSLKELYVREGTPSLFCIMGEPRELFFFLIFPQVTGLDTADVLQWRFPWAEGVFCTINDHIKKMPLPGKKEGASGYTNSLTNPSELIKERTWPGVRK